MVAPIDPSKKSLQNSSSTVVVRQTETLQISSGPLPDPETLGKYDKVYPGLAKCIVESFESEYRHRHEMEVIALKVDVSALELDHSDIKRGQLLGACRNEKPSTASKSDRAVDSGSTRMKR